MKKILFFAAAMLLFAACSKDDEDSGLPAMSDPNDVCSAMDDLIFMEYCYENFDINGDGKVSKEEAAAVREIDLPNPSWTSGSIKSLKGIAYFSNLEKLYTNYADLITLDVSKNTELKYLYCYQSELTSLDVRNCTALIELYCDANALTSLDVSQNTALEVLNCDSNELTLLDVSKNTALKGLRCRANKLTSMDISKNTALEWFSCSDNPGDGTTFSVKAWFDNNIPSSFTDTEWYINGKYIQINYHK